MAKLGHFRPSCCPRWSWMGLNYPFFIGNQLIFLTFCSRIDPRRRRCPRWPGFGLFPASMRSVRVEVGLKLSVFHMGSIPINHFWLQNRPQGQRVALMAKLWPFPALMWSQVVMHGSQLSVFHWESTHIFHFLLQNRPKAQKVPQMARFWAVSGLHEVREG